MRAIARMFRNADVADYGLEHALPTAELGRRVVVAGGKSPQRVLLDPIKRAIAGNLAVYGAEFLQGIVNGQQRNFGECRDGKRKLRFQVWLPHLGIAVDTRRESEADEDLKRAWCREQKIVYFAPGDCVDDGQLLREAVDKRREVVNGIDH